MNRNEKAPAATEALKEMSNDKPDLHIVGEDTAKVNPDLTAIKELGLPLNTQGIPSELRQRRSWILTEIKRNEKGGLAKPPVEGYGPRTPGSWLTFDEAVSKAADKWASRTDPELLAVYPAYVLQDGDGCIDLDMHAPDKTGQRMDHYARLMAAAKGCYIEESISGNGWHIIGTIGKEIVAFNTTEEGTEIQLKCHRGHYVCLTGKLTDNAKPDLLFIAHVINEIPRRINASTEDRPKEAGKQPPHALESDDVKVFEHLQTVMPAIATLCMTGNLRDGTYETSGGGVLTGSDLATYLAKCVIERSESREQAFRIIVNLPIFKWENRSSGKKPYKTEDSYRAFIWKNWVIKNNVQVNSMNNPEFTLGKAADDEDFVFFSDEDELPVSKFVIENVLPVGLTEIYARSGAGKSYAAVMLQGIVAQGTGYFGINRVDGGLAIYGAIEAPETLPARRQAWCDVYNDGKPLVNAIQINNLPDLNSQAGCDQLLRLLKTQQEKKGVPVKLFIIDTFSDVFTGKQSDNDEVAAFLIRLRRIAVEMDMALVLIHHTGHDTSRARGASAHLDKCDAVYSVTSTDKMKTLTLENVKMKVGTKGKKYTFESQTVVVNKKVTKAEEVLQTYTSGIDPEIELLRQLHFGDNEKTQVAFGGLNTELKTVMPGSTEKKSLSGKDLASSIYQFMRKAYGNEVVSASDLKMHWALANTEYDIEDRAWTRALSNLVEQQLIRKEGKTSNAAYTVIAPVFKDGLDID